MGGYKVKKIMVAMSGGVDSSVVAYHLKKEGFLVEGVYQKVVNSKKYYTSLSLDYFKTTWRDKDEDGNGNIIPASDYAREYTFLFGAKIGMEF